MEEGDNKVAVSKIKKNIDIKDLQTSYMPPKFKSKLCDNMYTYCHTTYFWALVSFKMFAGPLYHMKRIY